MNIRTGLLILLFSFSTVILAQEESGKSNSKLPVRGTSKDYVETHFGVPKSVRPAVGDPPISQWVYDQFTVVFEYSHVIHAYRRDFSIENRPADTIPKRPDLTLPTTQTSKQVDTQIQSNDLMNTIFETDSTTTGNYDIDTSSSSEEAVDDDPLDTSDSTVSDPDAEFFESIDDTESSTDEYTQDDEIQLADPNVIFEDDSDNSDDNPDD